MMERARADDLIEFASNFPHALDREPVELEFWISYFFCSRRVKLRLVSLTSIPVTRASGSLSA